MIRNSGLAFLVLLASLASLAWADEIDDTLGEHVVQPGETLWSITEKYLGDQSLWRENWQLNPGIADPNKLRIGHRLTVITERRITARKAEVVATGNEVEKNLQRTVWEDATRGDDLEPRDGLRTLRNASARLRFNDNTALQLTEYSQIFLEQRETTLRNVDTSRIEVVRGGAELVFEPISRDKTEIELVTGPAVTRPEATADGHGRLKAVAAESGGAKVMVYSGFSAVDAGGESVRVGAGLGTAVPENGPPSAPEKLLGSPRGLSPGEGARWAVANMPLSWHPLSGASDYIVEICRDDACNVLAQRQAGLTETKHTPRLTRVGRFWWRVTAVSASGLEGYPSRTVSFDLPELIVDEMGPRVALVPVGFYRREAGRLWAGPDTRLDLVAHDDAIGVASVEYRWNEGEWQSWERGSLPLPGGGIGAVLEARATDRLGKVGPVVRLEIVDLE